MAIDAYMCFQQYGGSWLTAESQVDLSKNKEALMTAPFAIPSTPSSGTVPNVGPGIFEIEDFSFDIEQVLNIGSSSSGAGAGKVTFNPFSITRPVDKCSPKFFEMACSGTPFQLVTLALRKSAGANSGSGGVSGLIFLRFDFKLVAVKTISWAQDEVSPKETVTFEYGGMMINYTQQKPDGTMMAANAGGWNRVKNVQDTSTTLLASAH